MKYIKKFKIFNESKFVDNYFNNHFTSKYSNKYSDDDSEGEDDFLQIINILEKDCKKFLNELNNTNNELLFRGCRYVNDTYTSGIHHETVDLDREPLDTNSDVSEIFDDMFKDKFGTMIRNSCAFATKTPSIANMYGNIYMFFPIGDYEYYWNKEVEDLFTSINRTNWYLDYTKPVSRYETHFAENEQNKISYGEWLIEVKKVLTENIKNIVSGYEKGNLEKCDKQELMFLCKEYYLVDGAFYNKMIDYLEKRRKAI